MKPRFSNVTIMLWTAGDDTPKWRCVSASSTYTESLPSPILSPAYVHSMLHTALPSIDSDRFRAAGQQVLQKVCQIKVKTHRLVEALGGSDELALVESAASRFLRASA